MVVVAEGVGRRVEVLTRAAARANGDAAGKSRLAFEEGAGGSSSAMLFAAVRAGRGSDVASLAKAGLAVDVPDVAGMTALMLAATLGHAHVVKALLDAEAAVDKSKPDGRTALIFACEEGHAEVAAVLLDAGADVNKAKAGKKTALMLASQDGHLDVVKVLLGAGAAVDKTCAAGRTALMYAAKQGHAGVAQALLDAGAVPDRADASSWTPLMLAERACHLQVMYVLLGAGANADSDFFGVQDGFPAPEVEELLTWHKTSPIAKVLRELHMHRYLEQFRNFDATADLASAMRWRDEDLELFVGISSEADRAKLLARFSGNRRSSPMYRLLRWSLPR